MAEEELKTYTDPSIEAKDESLSGKICLVDIAEHCVKVVPVGDIKEAVRKLNEDLITPNSRSKKYIEVGEFLYYLKKRFGGELIPSPSKHKTNYSKIKNGKYIHSEKQSKEKSP